VPLPTMLHDLRGRVTRAEPWIGPSWLGLLFLALFAGAWVFLPAFGQPRNLANVLAAAVPLAIVSVGQTWVVLTGGIDISVAAVMSLGLTMSMGLMAGGEGNLALALVLPVLAGCLVGVVSGGTVVGLRVPPFMATLGTASIVQGIVFAYTNYSTYGSPHPAIIRIGFTSWGPVPALLLLFLPLGAMALFIQNSTRAGQHLYALGDDEAAARHKGIATNRLKLGVYVLCGGAAALAGVALATRQGGGEPLGGSGYEWSSVAAVVIGGTVLRGGRGGVAGTFLAVLILGIVENALNLTGISAFWQSAIRGLIVLVAVGASAAALLHPVRAWQLSRAARAEA
jgi:ribose transport system permease protein